MNNKDSNTICMKKLLVTSSPHIHSQTTVKKIMWDVNIALVPALLVAIVNYRMRAVVLIALSILGALAAEYFCQKIIMKKDSTLSDGSAVLTGLLLAFTLPAGLPAWIAFLGGFIAISIAKQAYGGLGQNVFNPALFARAFLLTSWPVYMNTWLKPVLGTGTIDAITSATPLALLKEAVANPSSLSAAQTVMNKLGITFNNLLLGTGFAGSLGETSKLALLIGAIYLIKKEIITWHIPLTMISTVFFGALIYSSGEISYAFFHLLSGGLLLGAFFMATDMVTTPVTKKGQIIFALGCGLLTLLIRLKGGFPEGVCYSILLMNALVPLIDKFIKPDRFGFKKEEKA